MGGPATVTDMPTFTVIGSTAARHHSSRSTPPAPELVVGFGFGTTLAKAWEDAGHRFPDLKAVTGAPVPAGQIPPRCSPTDFGRYVLVAAQLAWDESASAEEIPPRLRSDVVAFWRLATSSAGPAAAQVKGQGATRLKAAFGRAGTRDQVWLFAASRPLPAQ